MHDHRTAQVRLPLAGLERASMPLNVRRPGADNEYMNPNSLPPLVPVDEVAEITRELARLNDVAAELAARRARLVAGSLRWLPGDVLAPRSRPVRGA